MFCTKCGNELKDGDLFCGKCGTARPQVFCSECGEKLNASAKSCLKCGTRVVVAETEPKSAEPHDVIPPIAPNPKLLLCFAVLALIGFSVLPMVLSLDKLNSDVKNIAFGFGGACRIAAFAVLGFHKGMRGIALPGIIGTTLTFGSLVFRRECSEIGCLDVNACFVCIGILFMFGALQKMWHLVPRWAFWPSILGWFVELWLSVSEIILFNQPSIDQLPTLADFYNMVRWSWLASPVLLSLSFVSILLRRGKLDLATHSASLVSSTDLCLNDPSRLVSFNGRVCRSAYWGMVGLGIVVGALSGICFAIGDGISFLVELSWACVGWAIILAFHWLVAFPCVIRRGHDFGLPGWVVVLLVAFGFIPLTLIEWLPGQVAFIVLVIGLVLELIVCVVLGCIDSTQGKNRYGPAPKAARCTFVPRTII